MPSPFPGMNPYLEQAAVWQDFHERFLPAMADFLGGQLAPNYIVKVEEHIYLHDTEAEERQLVGRADVAVSEGKPGSGGVSLADLAAPASVWKSQLDSYRQSYIEILDRRSRQLITVVELLSLENKLLNRELYIYKQDSILNSEVHLVEIDLLRGGPRMPWEDMPECDYYALVSRELERPRAGIWPLKLRDRLPVIPIPVKPEHAEARLALQAILHRVYDAAHYERYIYDIQPEPPLSAEDAAWAKSLLGTTRS